MAEDYPHRATGPQAVERSERSRAEGRRKEGGVEVGGDVESQQPRRGGRDERRYGGGGREAVLVAEGVEETLAIEKELC